MPKPCKLKLIVAMCRSRGIGNDNKIPWKIKKELIYFSKCTSGEYGKCMKTDNKRLDNIKKSAIIMGKNTWNSLPKFPEPLPYRDNIIISTSIPEYNSNKSCEYFYNNGTCSDFDLIMHFSSISRAMAFCYSPILPHQNGDGIYSEVGNDTKREKRENMINSSIYKSEIDYYDRYENVWVIGGSQIYDSFMKESKVESSNLLIDEFHITYIDGDYKCDTFFPLIENMNHYYVDSFNMCKSDDGTGCEVDLYFIVFKRILSFIKCDNDNSSNITSSDNILLKRVHINSDTYSGNDSSNKTTYCNIKDSVYCIGNIENKHLKIFASLFSGVI